MKKKPTLVIKDFDVLNEYISKETCKVPHAIQRALYGNINLCAVANKEIEALEVYLSIRKDCPCVLNFY